MIDALTYDNKVVNMMGKIIIEIMDYENLSYTALLRNLESGG